MNAATAPAKSKAVVIPEVVSVVGAVGLRLSKRKRAAIMRALTLGHERWNALTRALPPALDSIPRESLEDALARMERRLEDPKLTEKARKACVKAIERTRVKIEEGALGAIRQTRYLAAWVRELAPRDPELPVPYCEGVEMRVAACLWGAYRKATREAGRIRWVLDRDDDALAGRPQPDGSRPDPLDHDRRRELEERLRALEDDPLLASLPQPRPTEAEAAAAWAAWLDGMVTAIDVSIVQANRDSLRLLASTDPPPLDIVRGREAPGLLSESGTPVLVLPVCRGDGTAIALERIHPAWSAAGIREGTRRRNAIAVPMTAEGRENQRDMHLRRLGMSGGLPLGRVVRATIALERRGPRDEDVRIRAQIAISRTASPEVRTSGYLAVWFGLFPRLAVLYWSGAKAVEVDRVDEVTPLLDRARGAMRDATLGLGPVQHGDGTHAALRSLTHELTTRLVRLAVERKARILMADVSHRRRKLTRRRRGRDGRWRWIASSWNHALLREQITAKCVSGGLPEPGMARVTYYECPGCALGAWRSKRTAAEHKACVERVRKSGYEEYSCERCEFRGPWLRSRALTVARSWLRSQKAKNGD